MALRSPTRLCNIFLSPSPRLILLPQKISLSTSNTPQPHPQTSPPRKPEPAVPLPKSSGYSLQDLGAGRGVRIVVIACLSVFATMETIFYVRVAWAYSSPAEEVERGSEGK
ncbi:hypothetical protein MMC32_005980 [Xylographa parallela]|nr:hypothetical protein [Xylographa parallela]